jgi:hypothetical protein
MSGQRLARRNLLLTTVLGLSVTAAIAADGLRTPVDDLLWPTWQVRLSVTTSAPAAPWSASLVDGQRLRQASLLGDVYLGRAWLPQPAQWRGGLRATGGMLIGPLGPSMGAGSGVATADLWSLTEPVLDATSTDLALRPYVGIGYAGQSLRSGWGVSADLGLVASDPAALTGLGRGLWAGEGSAVWRRLELQPVVRFGVRYAF